MGLFDMKANYSLSLVPLLFGLSNAVQSAEVVLNFDDLSPNTVAISNEYAQRGIVFKNQIATDILPKRRTKSLAINVLPGSPIVAHVDCCHSMFAQFSEGHSKLAMKVYNTQLVNTPVKITLEAFNATGRSLRKISTTLKANDTNTAGILNLASSNIRSFRLSANLPVAFAVDDIKYDAALPFLLKGADNWMYQIQHLNFDGAVDKLAATPYRMLVLEPTSTNKGDESFNTKAMLKALRKLPDGGDRLLIAYIDIGEAEEYRTYWKSNWKAPTQTTPGNPSFILKSDPDGWSENHVVAYWDPRWKQIWLGSNNRGGLVESLARMGFDGVYLDWVEAYNDDTVWELAESLGKDSAMEMLTFIKQIKQAGKRVNKDFIVIQQNSPELLVDLETPLSKNQLLATVDAIGMENNFFEGDADAEWDDPNGTDIPTESEENITNLGLWREAGKPIFTVDYALKCQNVDISYTKNAAYGFRPLVTRVALSNLTTTPPWNYLAQCKKP
jgi:cysteinyl-tRNA synthetase, unknown class